MPMSGDTICGCCASSSILCLVVNTGAGLALAVTRGGFLGQLGLPPPLPFYADLMAVFLVGPAWASSPPC